MKRSAQKGFTLIELMIVIAIIGILAAVAVPQYSQYTRRATFTEIKLAATPIKSAVEVCYQRNGANAACNASAGATASANLPGQVNDKMLERAASSVLVGSVTLADNGGNPVITVTPNEAAQNANGLLASDTFVLRGLVEGSADDRRIERWTEEGGACDNGYC